MVEIGQLRRWTWKRSPLPIAWEDRVFLIIEEKLRWIDREGTRHRSFSFIIDGQAEDFWREDDIERMSELIESP
jgi:hypothetical protein